MRVQVYFCARDSNLIRAESNFGVGFIFHPRVHLKPEKTWNPKTPKPKTPETQKKAKKNLKETWKTLESVRLCCIGLMGLHHLFYKGAAGPLGLPSSLAAAPGRRPIRVTGKVAH
jgi:hypothetical protein